MSGEAGHRPGRLSLRSQLLLGILLPVLVLIGINTISLYRQALRNANLAYDRTLLASAKIIGEQLELEPGNPAARLRATVPYSALEAFDADNRSRMYYKVSGFAGEMVSGYEELPAWRGKLPVQGPYAALVDFYDDHFRGEPVRVAVLLQPVAGREGHGMATVQVAETLELRQMLARQILVDTLWRQALLVLVISAVVVWVVQRATRPVREVSAQLLQRRENDLAPIAAGRAPRELLPLIAATNQVMARLAHLLEHQKRFVRDTAHQLRTPLAVLHTQLQSAQRGDVAAAQALQEIERHGRTRHAAGQPDAGAGQGGAVAPGRRHARGRLGRDHARRGAGPGAADRAAAARLRHRHEPAPVRAHEWALRELTRNLLHNAIKLSPRHGRLGVRLDASARQATLRIADSGPGITPELRQRLFEPFSSGDPRSGSGLGLTICQEIVSTLGGEIRLDNRSDRGRITGLDAIVRLPLADNAAA